MRDIDAMKLIDDEMRDTDASICVMRTMNGQFDHYALRGERLRSQVVRDMVNDGWLVELGGEILRRA